MSITKVLLLAIALISAAACERDKPKTTKQASVPSAQTHKRAPRTDQRTPLLANTEKNRRFGSGLLAKDKLKKDDKKKTDYWSEVVFGRREFEHTRYYVKRNYIDPYIDEKMAYISAANYALLSMKTAYELYPESFVKLRKNHPDEEGSLAGTTSKLQPNQGYVLHKWMKRQKKKTKRRKRLSDDEIRKLRATHQARRRLLKQHWALVPFGEQDFWAIIDWIKEHGAKEKEFDLKQIYVAAAQGYLSSMDPHSSLVSRKAWVRSTNSTKDSSFEGIGAILTTRGGNTIVESPLEGRPAFKAGLRAGDMIIKVDKKAITDLPLPQVVQRIRGKKGTRVVLTVRREGHAKDFDIPIVRAHIAIRNVQGRMIRNHKGFGYIKLTGFVDTSHDEIMKMYSDLQAKNGAPLRGLVLDLRNNSGGLLQQAVEIANRFVSKGIIVTIKNRRFDDKHRYATPENTLTVPLVVLVNDGSASASEILASAVQEHSRGLIIGDRTFGKASVQTLFPNSRWQPTYYIKLTISRYYSPTGRTLQVTGVVPDVKVPETVGGKMRLGFREENLSNHLSQIGRKRYTSPNAALVTQLKPCITRYGLAEKLHAKNPHPQIKFDYQLMKGADYLECLIRHNKRHVVKSTR